MITERDLAEAIAECEGIRNPNASTCIKLAAFYTIKREMFGNSEQLPQYSYAAQPQASPIAYSSGTEFSEKISGKEPEDVLAVVDDLMTTLSVVNPRLYDGVLRKLNQI